MQHSMLTICLLGFPLLSGFISPARAAEAANEIQTVDNVEILAKTVAALKLQLGLNARQIELIVEKSAALQANVEAVNENDLTDKLNNMIVESEIAGAQIVNRHDPMYWLYRARFGINNPPAPAMIPAWLTRRGNNWYVYQPSTLASRELHLKRGDEVVFPSGFPLDFTGAPATKKSVKVKSLSWDKPATRDITLDLKSPEQLLLEIMQSNKKIMKTGLDSTGFLPLPSIDLASIRTDFVASLQAFEGTTSQLVIDLRGPFGEGGLSGIEMFLNDKGQRVNYKKPLFLLVDRYTSGGKETLAGMLQRHAHATLIGEVTSGRTAPVELTELSDNKFLLITEHPDKSSGSAPLVPDYPIKDSLMFAAGQDEILSQTLKLVTKK